MCKGSRPARFLTTSIREVGDALGLGDPWFNTGPAGLTQFGPPPCLEEERSPWRPARTSQAVMKGAYGSMSSRAESDAAVRKSDPNRWRVVLAPAAAGLAGSVVLDATLANRHYGTAQQVA